MKCKNCGAELNNGKCEYCGAVYAENQLHINMKIDPEVMARHLKELKERPLIFRGYCDKDDDSVMHKVEIKEA